MTYPAPKTLGDVMMREKTIREFLDTWPGSPYEQIENNILHKKLREVFTSQPFTDALAESGVDVTPLEVPDGDQ